MTFVLGQMTDCSPGLFLLGSNSYRYFKIPPALNQQQVWISFFLLLLIFLHFLLHHHQAPEATRNKIILSRFSVSRMCLGSDGDPAAATGVTTAGFEEEQSNTDGAQMEEEAHLSWRLRTRSIVEERNRNKNGGKRSRRVSGTARNSRNLYVNMNSRMWADFMMTPGKDVPWCHRHLFVNFERKNGQDVSFAVQSDAP